MLVPYSALQNLPQDTLDNLIKEYLFTQVEDSGFANTDADALSQAVVQCRLALKSGELQVEYSEDDESIAIRPRSDLNICR